ncbi:MAG: hypothetical protein ABNH21_17375 [Glaciecola sp.]|jgi:hypothetical protein
MVKTHTSSNSELYESFINIFNDKLQAQPTEHTVTMKDDVWKFIYGRAAHIIDFTLFNNSYTQFVKQIDLIFDGEQIQISTIEFAKVIILSLMEGKLHNANAVRALECIALLFSFLKVKNVERLSREDLTDMYSMMLSEDPKNTNLVSRLFVPSYQSRLSVFDVANILRVLKVYGCSNLLIPDLHPKYYTQALNEACLSVMNITLSDYREGGSFNFLGLDTGRHFSDFCGEVFESHSVYATACRLTYTCIVQDVRKHIDYKTDYLIQRICVETLMGVNLNDIKDDRVNSMSSNKKELIYNRTLKLFCKHYNLIAHKANAFKLENVNSIVKKLNLSDMRFDNQEFVRAMLFTSYFGEHGKSRKQILKEYKSFLRASQIEVEWDIAKFDETVNHITQTSTLTPESAFVFCRKEFECCSSLRIYEGGIELEGSQKLYHALKGVESAGTTLFVAMTGWRASEFGFSLNNIDINVNQDVLDSLYTPNRFSINWVVPKTSSNTPLNREITLATYLLATQLAELNLSGKDNPCLYSLEAKTKFPNESKSPIDNRVETLWFGFCTKYSMFVELDEIKQLNSKHSLSSIEQTRLAHLLSLYDMYSLQTKLLVKLKDKVRAELPRYQLTRGKQKLTFKNQLIRYATGKLSSKESKLFDEYLSKETKNLLRTSSTKLHSAAVKGIRNEFLEGIAYPTTHALRHMWAEAVLRRYRGDIGKFIRANFKHLDERFFMAYIRNKEMKTVYKIAERNVINSIVRHHLLSQKENQRDYAGGFDSYLNKVVKFTKILSHQEYINISEKIGNNRVEAIKANAWGTCLLRVGTNQHAKCSEDGIPQRHNASPKLCLGCINADISEGNFNGIVVYTRAEVEACRNEKLPPFVKKQCVKVLEPALRQVTKLRKNSGNDKYDKFINHLMESIEMAKREIDETYA